MYGRKITVEQPNNGGRTLGAFYFVNGKLVVLESTILPANGDYASPVGGSSTPSSFSFSARNRGRPN